MMHTRFGKIYKRNATNVPSVSDTREMHGNNVHILLIGESGSGKTTLLKTLYDMSGIDSSHIVPGLGSTPGTHTHTIYDIKFPCKDLILLNKSNNKEVDNERKPGWLQRLCFDDNVVLTEASGTKESINLKVMDTPGLNGINTDDSQTMFEVLKELRSMQYLNCIVFVISKTTPYNPSTIKSFKYYMKLVNAVNSRLCVMHTSYTANDLVKAEGNSNHFVENRISEFKKITDTEALHWFVDLLPLDIFEYQKYIRNTELLSLVNTSLNMGSFSTKNFNMIKTNDIKQIDNIVEASIKSVNAGYVRRVEQMEGKTGEISKEILQLQNRINENTRDIKVCNDEQHEITTPGLHLIKTDKVDQPWKWFKGQEYTFNVCIQGTYGIEKVETNTAHGYKCSWINPSQNYHTYKVTLKCNMFRGMNGTVSVYANRLDYYKARIDYNKKQILTLSTVTGELQEQIRLKSDQNNDIKTELDDIAKELNRNNYLLSHISSHIIDIELYPKVIIFYKGYDNNKGYDKLLNCYSDFYYSS